MKRKAEKQPPAAPISAIAARRAQQQKLQVTVPISPTPEPESDGEPPSKKARPSPAEEGKQADGLQSTAQKKSAVQRMREKKLEEQKQLARQVESKSEVEEPQSGLGSAEEGGSDESEEYIGIVSDEEEEEEEDDDEKEEEQEEDAALGGGDDDSYYESASNLPVEVENFALSKTRLNKKNIVYADKHTLCVRIKEKMNLALVGQYDIWVKRGVVSLMGAKLHPSPIAYRVYAPSTHSLPVIKCVSGVDGYAEVELTSCHGNGIYRLKDLSPLYQRIWNSKTETAADKVTLKDKFRRTFSVLYTSSDDPFKRHLRPLHLDKKWSTTIKVLSQRGGGLRVFTCGPKASGKSTFNRYLLNHLLSPAPQTESGYTNTDGVAFLDLDPGQPEFSPAGEIYLAHLRSPFFGPPFSHPTLEGSRNGTIIRAHHIGATSPKEDPDHYVLAAMDLMDHYRRLLESYPQCPLIINYPGWIFGLGLEVATWLIKSLGLSDVVYMSEKGPPEVVEPLGQAAGQAMVPLTTLPSQPTDYATRSSAQLRSMQMQSYFHLSHPNGLSNPIWSEMPLIRTKPVFVNYAGPRQGILGVMVLGSYHNPDLLRDLLDGAIVAVVAVENESAIAKLPNNAETAGDLPAEADGAEDEMIEDDRDEPNADPDSNMDDAASTTESQPASRPPSIPSLESRIIRTAKEDLPYLFVGAGSCTPPDPKASYSLGLAIVRAIHVSARKLELITPIPTSKIRETLERGHGIVLVRGQLDNPNWAISEEYHAARAAERRHHKLVAKAKKSKGAGYDLEKLEEMSQTLRERVRRAGNVPWMTVVEDSGRRHGGTAHREKTMWKLRKKAYPGSESETDW